jgi:hypothetical protein
MAAVDWNKMNAPDGGEFAAWMLSLLDEGDQRFATIEIPSWLPDDRLDDAEAAFIRAYNRAKRERPNLAVKLEGPDAARLEHHPDARGLVILHEPRWVDGRCVNGCTDTRTAA